MASAGDPNRIRPGDDGWSPDEPGSDRAARFGLTSGAILAIVAVITLLFLGVVIF